MLVEVQHWPMWEDAEDVVLDLKLDVRPMADALRRMGKDIGAMHRAAGRVKVAVAKELGQLCVCGQPKSVHGPATHRGAIGIVHDFTPVTDLRGG